MKFIIDTQLPPVLESLFAWKGHTAQHNTRWPNGHLMDDKQIISIAQKEDFIVVTKDKDFLNYFLLFGFPPAILLISIGNVSNTYLTKLLSDNFNQIEIAFQSNAMLIVLEPDRLVVW